MDSGCDMQESGGAWAEYIWSGIMRPFITVNTYLVEYHGEHEKP